MPETTLRPSPTLLDERRHLLWVCVREPDEATAQPRRRCRVPTEGFARRGAWHNFFLVGGSFCADSTTRERRRGGSTAIGAAPTHGSTVGGVKAANADSSSNSDGRSPDYPTMQCDRSGNRSGVAPIQGGPSSHRNPMRDFRPSGEHRSSNRTT